MEDPGVDRYENGYSGSGMREHGWG